MCRAGPRVARAPRSRTPSNSDSSDMKPAAVVQCPPGTRGLRESAAASSGCRRRGIVGRDLRTDLRGDMADLLAQLVEARVVGLAPGTHEQVARGRLRQHLCARELSQSPLQPVSSNRGKPELRHHDSDAHVPERRIESLDVEEARRQAATRAQQTLDVGGPRYPSSTRKAERLLRRRRTCWAAVPSDACAPSSDGDSKLHDPTSFPCACETHASESGAYCGGGRWACPFWLQR